MSEIDNLLRTATKHSEKFSKRNLGARPARRVAVVTCMDSRFSVSKMLGLREGDAHVIRNAGGRTPEALRSLIASQRLLDTNEIMVVQHTDCGMENYSDEDIREKLKGDLGVDATDIEFLTFSNVEQNVLRDVEFLNNSPLIAKDSVIRGFVYDVETGELTEVSG